MKKTLLPLLAVFLLLQSCTDNKKKALAFNEKIAGISQTIYGKGREWGAELQPAFTMQDYSKLKEKTDDLMVYITHQIDTVSAMDNVGGSEKLKTSMVEYLKFEKMLIGEVFVPFSSMDSTTTDEQRQAAIQRLQDRSKDEAEYLEKVRAEQTEYAKKNGFKVVNTMPTN
jgi:elongation factor P--beta-lysine ligase